MNKLTLILMLSLILGCTRTEIITEYRTIPLNTHKVSRPSPLVMKPVEFKIIELQENILTLSFKDYENLASNMSSITLYIKQQMSIIEYYENMITQEKENVKVP